MKKPQLFLFHFAGGNVYSFQFIIPFLSDFEVVALELPGRGKRIKEKLIQDFDLAALDFYNQITEKLTSSRFLIYGHSMGAYIGLRVSKMLEKISNSPIYLIVSGNPGPGVTENRNRYLLGNDDFIEELRKLGGVPEQIIENKELINFFVPILKADFEIAERNELAIEPAINASIYAMMGSKENNIEKISNWGRFTKSCFNCEIIEGDHFFIYKHPKRIATIIKDCYDKFTLLQYQQNEER